MTDVDTVSFSNMQLVKHSEESGFNRRQAWLKELEKARDMASGFSAGSDRNQVAGPAGEEGVDHGEKEALSSRNGMQANDVDESSPALPVVDGHSPHSRQPLAESAARVPMVSAYGVGELSLPTPRIQNGMHGARVQGHVQLDSVEMRLKSEFALQNIKLVPENGGVRLLIRDYRLDDRQVSRLVSQIKDYLKELGLPVYATVVNGRSQVENNEIKMA
jgi:hypothetical protein